NQPLVLPKLFSAIRVQGSRRFRRNRKLKDLKLGRIATSDRNRESPKRNEREVHHEIPEICCTACFTGPAARVFAGCGRCRSEGRRGWPARLRLRLLPGLSVCLRALRLLWSKLVLWRGLYRRRPLVPRLGTSVLRTPLRPRLRGSWSGGSGGSARL